MSVILMYHSVADEILDQGIQVRPDILRQHLDWLEAAGFRWASVETAVQEPHAQWVAFTFDDGFADNLPAFRHFSEQEIPATLFVAPDHLGESAVWASVSVIRSLPLVGKEDILEIQELGISIGSHSWQHHSFPRSFRRPGSSAIGLQSGLVSAPPRPTAFPAGLSLWALSTCIPRDCPSLF